MYCLRNVLTQFVIPDLISLPRTRYGGIQPFQFGFPLPTFVGTSLPLRKQGRE